MWLPVRHFPPEHSHYSQHRKQFATLRLMRHLLVEPSLGVGLIHTPDKQSQKQGHELVLQPYEASAVCEPV